MNQIGVPLDSYTFNNFHVEHISYPMFATTGNFKISNSTFKDCTYQVLSYSSGSGIGIPYNTSKIELCNNKTFQPMCVFNNCVFDNIDAGVYGIHHYYGGRLLIKDCEFKNLSYGILTGYGAVTFLHGTNTFTNVTTHKRWSNQGTYLHVRELDLTINDENGNPLENAAISIIQQSTIAKEIHVGHSNSDGKLVNVWGDNPIFVEKEETSTGVYEQWSNDAESGLCHRVIVSYEGYVTAYQDVEFTEEKTNGNAITIQLELPSECSSSATRISTNRITGREI